MLVCTRCLPSDHLKSLAGHTYSDLPQVKLTLPWKRDHASQEWEQSELYKESTRSEFTHPFYHETHMRLTWPAV